MFKFNSEYKKWVGRLGIEFEDIKKLIKEGMSKEDLIKLVKQQFKDGMKGLDYPVDAIFEADLKGEFEKYYNTVFLPINEIEKETERAIKSDIGTYATKERKDGREDIFIAKNKVGKTFKSKSKYALSTAKRVITNYKKHYSKLDKVQKIKMDYAQNYLRYKRDKLKKGDVNKYLAFRFGGKR